MCQLDSRQVFETNRLFLLFTLFWVTGVLNVEISEKCALDLKQREIIILTTVSFWLYICLRHFRILDAI